MLKIAIISDLHCNHSSFTIGGQKVDDTFLQSDMLREDDKIHPVYSALTLIKNESINADITLCPGDFTNKSDPQGLISGWDFVLEISEALGSEETIGTLGNHDVDSHESFSSYSLQLAKGIKKGFPLKNDFELESFWSRGCAFLERKEVRILVINSSHFHHNKKNSGQGQVDADLIKYVKSYMDEHTEQKVNLVLAHHHPIDHSRLDLGEDDTMIKGAELLEAIGQYDFDLFIHGHKHDPWLSYYNFKETTGGIPIFSAGSFSAKATLGFTGVRNRFHIVSIDKSSGSSAKGQITSYTYLRGKGWKIVNDDSSFPAYTGFGYYDNLAPLIEKVQEVMNGVPYMDWVKLIDSIPEIQHLTPNAALDFERKLKEFSISLSKTIACMPDKVYNLKAM